MTFSIARNVHPAVTAAMHLAPRPDMLMMNTPYGIAAIRIKALDKISVSHAAATIECLSKARSNPSCAITVGGLCCAEHLSTSFAPNAHPPVSPQTG